MRWLAAPLFTARKEGRRVVICSALSTSLVARRLFFLCPHPSSCSPHPTPPTLSLSWPLPLFLLTVGPCVISLSGLVDGGMCCFAVEGERGRR